MGINLQEQSKELIINIIKDKKSQWLNKNKKLISRLSLSDEEAIDCKEYIDDYIEDSEKVRVILLRLVQIIIVVAIIITVLYYFNKKTDLSNVFDLFSAIIGFGGSGIAAWGYLVNNKGVQKDENIDYSNEKVKAFMEVKLNQRRIYANEYGFFLIICSFAIIILKFLFLV